MIATTAFLAMRPEPRERHQAFARGLAAVAGELRLGAPGRERLGPGSLLLTWGRTRAGTHAADQVERAGGHVVVAENGYLGRDEAGRQLYALALGQHGGAGRWPDGDSSRWERLGIVLAPWRAAGEHVLVLGQRGIGHKAVAMPADWDRALHARLAREVRRPVRFRPHPAALASKTEYRPLEEDLRGCHAVVTWSSGAALKALVAGIPVFHGMPRWIGAAAARPVAATIVADLEAPALGDRLPMLQRLAWAQWTIDEIAAGEPFRHLLTMQAGGAA